MFLKSRLLKVDYKNQVLKNSIIKSQVLKVN